MKTKFYWFALLASAALIAQAQAGGNHGGGGGSHGGFAGGGGGSRGGGGGHISSPSHAAGPSFHSAPHANFGGGRTMYSGQRFSTMGGRSSSNAFRQHSFNSSGGASIGARQFTPGSFNRGNGVTRFADRGNRPGRITNPTGVTQNQTGTRFGNNRHDRLGQPANNIGGRNGTIRNRDGQVRNGNNLPANWRNHVAGQRSADWHRDWDRGRDHFWNGHRCRFVDGSWFIFDFGFPWYPYGYPYDYYAYDYYPGYYDSDVYEGQEYYGSSDQDAGGTVAAAQEQLARQGYYRGEIDGVLGPATRRAIASYQSSHGLRVTGALTTDTLEALGLPRVANN